MNVKQLIEYLEKIENKEQEVFVSNDEFDIKSNLSICVEIKSTTEPETYKNGVYLIFYTS